MKTGHLSAIAMVLSGLAMLVSGYHSWEEALTPANVGALLMTLAGVATALSVDPIQGRRVLTADEREALRAKWQGRP